MDFLLISLCASEAAKGLLQSMTQDERWVVRYNEVVEFITANHRNPSKHHIEEHLIQSSLKGGIPPL